MQNRAAPCCCRARLHAAFCASSSARSLGKTRSAVSLTALFTIQLQLRSHHRSFAMPPRRKRQRGAVAVSSEAAPAAEPTEAALWMGWCQEDLEKLHQEVEAGALEVGVELPAFLDATSFWETPRRARQIAERLQSLAEELDAQIGRVRSATEPELRCGGATAARYLRQLRKAVQQAGRAAGGWKWLDTDKTGMGCWLFVVCLLLEVYSFSFGSSCWDLAADSHLLSLVAEARL
eukprot:s299_g11.t1